MPKEGLKREDDRGEPGKVAKAIMLASALLVAALFGYMIYHALTAPAGGTPEARVLDTALDESGDVVVRVALENDATVGLREAVVEVACEEPAPQISFMNIPARGTREGYVFCPPGTQDPQASLVSYTRT